MVSITALMDDRPGADPRLIGEHGLSLFVGYGDKKILFDCGTSGNTARNAEKLGIDLKDLDAVVLSHGHYDHARGYRTLVREGLGSSVLWTGPGFFRKKMSRDHRGLRDLSAGFGPELLKEHQILHREVLDETELFPGVLLFTGFPRVSSFEQIPQRFLLETEEGLIPDDFSDEVAMALRVEGGLLVLVGCSHPGIVNMVSHIARRTGEKIRGVFGGTHLMEADDERIRRTVRALCDMGLETLGLSHCSGDGVDPVIAAEPGVRGCHLRPGDRICFD